jgi:hypothetical protein
MDEAFQHVLICQQLLEQEPLSVAQAYCARQRIVPPLVARPGTARDNAPGRMQAAAKLRDYGWWVKQIKLRNARDRRRLGGARAAAHQPVCA